MCSPEMKLSYKLGQRNPNEEGDEEEPPENVQKAAKKIISTVYRKSIVEAIMPSLLNLREFLIQQRSPLMKDCLNLLRYATKKNFTLLLLQIFRELHNEYGEQFEDFLYSKNQIRAEILFELRKSDNADNNLIEMSKENLEPVSFSFLLKFL